MCEIRFFVCEHCGNIIGVIHSAGVPMMCCGQKMTALIPNTTDAAGEKHLPIVTPSGELVEVSIGSVEHPMTEEHSILWIYLKTDRGGQRKCLKTNEVPKAVFAIREETPLAVYAYCNLHGLWMTEL